MADQCGLHKKVDLYRKIGMRILGDLFSKDEKAPDDRTFYPSADAALVLGLTGCIEKSLQGTKKTIHKYFLGNFQCSGNDYNSAENTKILARPNFNSFANFDPLITNNGVLQSVHQGECVLGVLTEGRNK